MKLPINIEELLSGRAVEGGQIGLYAAKATSQYKQSQSVIAQTES